MDRSSQAIESTQADGGETEENASELLASALKKMDGLLGKYASNDEHAVCRYVCEWLRKTASNAVYRDLLFV